MKKKSKQFFIQGIYHRILVKSVSKKWLTRYMKSSDILGIYEHDLGRICIAKELPTEVKVHTIYHEISHHIEDTLQEIKNAETRCDLLGSYLMKLAEEKDKIQQGLTLTDTED